MSLVYPAVETDPQYGDDGNLRCPECGECMLHHTDVTVYSRPVEDGPVTAVCVRPDASISAQPGKWKGNPSGRRDGVTIRFYCENCDLDAELTIAQHKGHTAMLWRVAQ